MTSNLHTQRADVVTPFFLTFSPPHNQVQVH